MIPEEFDPSLSAGEYLDLLDTTLKDLRERLPRDSAQATSGHMVLAHVTYHLLKMVDYAERMVDVTNMMNHNIPDPDLYELHIPLIQLVDLVKDIAFAQQTLEMVTRKK